MKKLLALLVALTLVLGTMGALAEETPATSITVAVGAQFTTLDPALNTETVNNEVLVHMYNNLFMKDEAGQLVNMMCESYEVSEDGLTYTFKLLPGILWSDGVEVTANDFVYSFLRSISYGADNVWNINSKLEYIVGADEYNANALEVGESFDCTTADASSVGFKALDDYTLEVKLTKPCAYFLQMFTGNSWAPLRADFAPQHESLWAFEGGYPTTGMYTLEECSENEKCVLVKNPNYQFADTVLMDTITFLVMPDTTAQAFAFQNGEVDVALSVSSETALQYEGSPELWLISKSTNYFLAINSGATGPDWAKDANVRRALALAIDKDALVEVIGGPSLYPVLNGYVAYGMTGLNGDFREEGDADGYTLKYDPEQAKALLAEAGYDESNPLQIVYKYSNNGMHGDVATMLQSMWQAIGVDCTFEAVESGVFYDQVDQGQFEICRYGLSATDDPISFLKIWTTGQQVVASVDDPEYDKMVEAASLLIDPTEYYTELHKVEDYLCEENVYVIPLFNFNSTALVSSKVSGHRLIAAYEYFDQCVISD